MKKILTLMLSLLVLLLPALALSETVTASFFPIYLFASNLLEGTEGIELHSLAQPQTGCLHDFPALRVHSLHRLHPPALRLDFIRRIGFLNNRLV